MAHLKLIILCEIFCCIPCYILAQKDSIIHNNFFKKYSIEDTYFIDLSENNIACNTFSKHSYITIDYTNQFLLKELMMAHAEVVFKYKQNAFSLNCNHFGYSQFGELQALCGYARSFGKHVAFGLQFYYLMTHAAEYQSVHSFTFNVSCYVSASQNIGFGFSVYNPACLKYGVTGNTHLPTRFLTLFNYKIGKNILLCAELQKELKSQLTATVGASYRIKCLVLNLHCRLPTPQIAINARIFIQNFLIGMECSYQSLLGFTPKASLTYYF